MTNNYCLLFNHDTFKNIIEPFLKAKGLKVPTLSNGKKIAIYIRRTCIVNLLRKMINREITPHHEISSAFANKYLVDLHYNPAKKH